MCFINSRTCTITSTNNTCVIDFYFHSKLLHKYVNSKMKTESLKWTYFYDQSSNLMTALLKFFFMNWPARRVKWQSAGLTAQDSPRVSLSFSNMWLLHVCYIIIIFIPIIIIIIIFKQFLAKIQDYEGRWNWMRVSEST